MRRTASYASAAVLAATCGGVALGGLLFLVVGSDPADVVWGLTTALGIVPAAYWVIGSFRNRRLGVDLIALLALIGALAVGEYFAGAVIATMLATGRSLERWAAHRAEGELRLLLSRAPRSARRYEGDDLVTVALDAVNPGDRLLVGPGEVVPVDGTLLGANAMLDESALTGEPLPVERAEGEVVRSGVVNASGPFDLRATTDAEASTYAEIVRLVESAQASRSPFVRLADRYAAWFLLLSLAMAGAAWAISGEAARAVAVLVVATPCPLILAAPVAIVAGLSRTAKRGVVVKGGGALEQLAECHTLLLDKTGTLTAGEPVLNEVVTAGPWSPDDVLRLAASADQVSPHVLAAAVVEAARRRDLPLELPAQVEETPGQGIRAMVAGTNVAVGRAKFVSSAPNPALLRSARRRADLDGALTVFVAIDGQPAGVLVLDDPIRPDAARTVRALRNSGIERIVMVTGDRAEVAESVGAVIGVDAAAAEQTPADKVDVVIAEQLRAPVVMVGDGINDAPALAQAAVGVAIGARGATASSEAADAVLTVDRLDRVGEAVTIARRSLHIARQSVVAGMGASLGLMVVAALGYLPAALGAVCQEVIDLAVILNALRALRPTGEAVHLSETDSATLARFSAEHRFIHADIDAIRAAADALRTAEPATMAGVRAVHETLVREVLPHQDAEDEILFPAVSRVLGNDTTVVMSRAHVEIAHQVRRLGRLLDAIGPDGPDEADIAELRRLLYGLQAVLRLHTAQEEEEYLSLAEPEVVGAALAGAPLLPVDPVPVIPDDRD
jgi:heavy metal translocating P-type ATPase